MTDTATIATSSMKKPRVGFWSVVSLATVAIFVVLLGYPLARLLIGTVSVAEGSGPFAVYADIFSKTYYLEAIGNSLLLAAAATVGALLVGVPLAYMMTRFAIPGKLIVRVAIVLTFVSPPFIGAYAWILLLGNNGFITQALSTIGISLPSIYGWGGTILVLVLQGFPFVFLMVSAGLRTVDQSIEDASHNMGRKPLRTMLSVTLPLIAPSISTGALVVFVTAFADFGTPAIIGQNLRVLPRLVYSEFVNETGSNMELAGALASILLVVNLIVLLLQRAYMRRRSYGQQTVNPLRPIALSRPRLAAAVVACYVIVGFACLPLLVIVVSSFLRTRRSVVLPEFTLEGYMGAPRLFVALGNTVLFTTIATVLCVVVGTLIGYVVVRRGGRLGGFIDVMSMTPYAVAGVVIGIAFSMAFGGAPFWLAGTGVILVMAYFLRRLPYTVRSVSGLLAQVGQQTEEASINLGIPPARTFLRVTVPAILPGIVSGALLTWSTVSREFNATVMLYSAGTTTMPVELFKSVLIGDYTSASVVGTVLIVMSAIPIFLLFKFMGKDEEFLV